MYKYSPNSLQILSTCDNRIQNVLNHAINIIDITIVSGYRGKDTQNEYYREGKSTKLWPESKHNEFPSIAIDIAPYNNEIGGIKWDDRLGFIYLAGIIMGIAHGMGYKFRWGGDWDQDNDPSDDDEKGLRDYGHFELME